MIAIGTCYLPFAVLAAADAGPLEAEAGCSTRLRFRPDSAGNLVRSAGPHPNPATTSVALEIETTGLLDIEGVTGSLVALDGRLVAPAHVERDLDPSGSNVIRATVATEFISSGAYFLRVLFRGDVLVWPLVINR